MRGVVALGAAAVGLMAAGEAAASGGFSCEADDAQARIMIQSGVTHGMGSPVFNFRAEAEVKGGEVADDLRKTDFGDEHLAQYWLGDGELKLVLYRERDGDKAHGSVEIVVRTKLDEEGGAKGTYEVSTFDVPADGGDAKESRATGEVSCSVE